eukprot:350688-Chlamydomonas_euryale.AAC.1
MLARHAHARQQVHCKHCSQGISVHALHTPDEHGQTQRTSMSAYATHTFMQEHAAYIHSGACGAHPFGRMHRTSIQAHAV